MTPAGLPTLRAGLPTEWAQKGRMAEKHLEETTFF
jgi:hypothetical protein